MKTVEALRTVLFLPTLVGSAWLLHTKAGWGWLSAVGLGLAIAGVVALAATLIHDRLTG
jgi:hypothetical protein